jgi:hypothetical protein
MRHIYVALMGVVAIVGCRDEELVDLSGGITGQVCNPVTGRPGVGATVKASWIDPQTEKAGEKTATADDNGVFDLGGLPVTTVKLDITGDNFSNVIENIEVIGLDDVQLTDPACRDLPTGPGVGEIVGQICNRHTGEYVTEGEVSVLIGDGTTITEPLGEDGSFALRDVPIGIWVLYVQAPGFQRSYQVEVVEGGQTVLEDQVITCEPFDTLSTGFIIGQICAPTSEGGVGEPVEGARVAIVGGIDGIEYEAFSQADGSFVIDGIPAPQSNLQVRAERGGFVYTWDAVNVFPISQSPDGTNLTLDTGCQPLAPDDGRSYLVVKGTFDKIEQVLGRMGLQNVDLKEGVPQNIQDRWSVEAFGNYDELASYDAVFVNCGISEVDLVEGLQGSVRANLKRYVQEGGSLYVSDWAYDLVEQVWPEKVNFLGDDLVNSSAEFGDDGTYSSEVMDAGLAEYVGASSVDIGFSFGSFAIVSQVAEGVQTFLKADINYRVNGGVSSLPDTPVTVGFQDGLGKVIFTSFHQESDTDGNTETLDGPEDLVLRYLIFSL